MASRQVSVAPSRGRRLARLNALRGPAALLVVLYHVRQIAVRDMGSAASFEFWRFGHAGVDLFFVISGFVIYLVHGRDIGQPSRARRFVARRLIRVYPPLWIVTSGVVIGALFTTHAVRPEKMDALFILRSYLLWPIRDRLPLVPPAWTLSHEVKFYLLFLAAIALPARVWKPLLLAVFVGSVFTGLIEAVTSVTMPFSATFLLSPYNLEFAGGVAAAMLVLRNAVLAPRVLALVGLIAWIVAAAHDQSLQAADVAQVIRYGVPSALIVVGLAARDIQRPEFRAQLLGLFGDASYAIYLIHLPVIVVAIRVASSAGLRPRAGTFAVVAAITVLVGIAFHITVERPVTRFLTLRFTANPRRTFAEPAG